MPNSKYRIKKKKCRVGEMWEGKRNQESIQLTDGSRGRMCAGGEKKCNKLLS